MATTAGYVCVVSERGNAERSAMVFPASSRDAIPMASSLFRPGADLEVYSKTRVRSTEAAAVLSEFYLRGASVDSGVYVVHPAAATSVAENVRTCVNRSFRHTDLAKSAASCAAFLDEHRSGREMEAPIDTVKEALRRFDDGTIEERSEEEDVEDIMESLPPGMKEKLVERIKDEVLRSMLRG